MALKVGELFASFNIDTSGVDEAMSGVEKKLSGLGSSMEAVGASMTNSVTGAMKNAFESIYNTGSEFEYQMAKVQAISGAEGEVFDDLIAKAEEMGATTSFTAKQAGEALEYMAMAGWEPNEMLDSLESVMDLAAATGLDLGRTSDIVTDAMTAFGMSADRASQFADVLAATSANANTNVDLMGETFKYVAPLAGAMGYSIEDMALAIGLMANSGVKGSQAGTALKNLLTNMAKPTDKVQEAMEELGITLDDGRGEMLSMRQVMQQLRKGFGGLKISAEELTAGVADLDTQLASGEIAEDDYTAAVERLMEKAYGAEGALKAQTAAALAGKYGLSGLLAIVNASEEDFEDLARAIDESGGATAEMVDTMMRSAQGEMLLFKSAVDGVKISLWNLSKDAVSSAVKGMTDLANSFSNASPEIQGAALKLGAVAAAAGPALTAIGGMVKALPMLVPALAALVSPLGLAAIGLTTLGLAATDADGTLGSALENMATGAAEQLDRLSESLVQQMSTISARIPALASSIASAVREALPSAVSAIITGISTTFDALANNTDSIVDIGVTILESVVSGFQQSFPKLMAAVPRLIISLASSLAQAAPRLLKIGGDIWETIQSGFNTAMGAAKDLIGGLVLGENYSADDSWKKVGAAVWEKIKEGISGFLASAKDLIGGLVLKDYTADTSWGQVGGAVWGVITAGMNNILTRSKDLIGNLTLGSDYSPDDSWGGVAGKIWGKITEAMGDLLGNAPSLLDGLKLPEGEYDADSTWKNPGAGIWNKIVSGFQEKLNIAGDILRLIIPGANEGPDKASWEGVGEKIWGYVKDKFGTAVDLIGKLVVGTDYSFETDGWEAIGGAAWNAVTGAFQGAGELVKKLVLGDEYSPDTSAWGDVGGKLWGAVTGAFGTGLELVKKLVLGKSYSPDASWASVGSKLWAKIRDGFRSAITTAGDWIKKLALGTAYTPDSSWADAGEAIWKTIKGGITATGDWLKEQLNYTPDKTTWGSVGGEIWTDITGGISEAIGAVTDFIHGILFPDGYTPGEQWADVGEKVWGAVTDNVKSGEGGASDWLYNQLGAGYTAGDDWLAIGQQIFGKLRDGIRSMSYELGSLCGEFVSYIMSPEGLTTIFNAGASIIGVLLEGVATAFTGAIGFIEGLWNKVLENFGLRDPEVIAQVGEAGAKVAAAVNAGLAEGIDASSAEYKGMGLQIAGLVLSGLGTSQVSADDPFLKSFGSHMAQGLQGTLGMAFANGGFDAEKIQTHFSLAIADALDEVIPEASAKTQDIIRDIFNGIGELDLEDSDLSRIGSLISQVITGSIIGSFTEEDISSLRESVNSFIAAGFDKLDEDTRPQVEAALNAMLLALDVAGLENMGSVGEEFWRGIYEAIQQGDYQTALTLMADIGAQMPEEFENSFNSYVPDLSEEGRKVAEEVSAQYQISQEAAGDKGKATAAAFETAVNSTEVSFSQMEINVTTALNDTGATLTGTASEQGASIGGSLISGATGAVDANASELTDSASQAGTDAAGQFSTALSEDNGLTAMYAYMLGLNSVVTTEGIKLVGSMKGFATLAAKKFPEALTGTAGTQSVTPYMDAMDRAITSRGGKMAEDMAAAASRVKGIAASTLSGEAGNSIGAAFATGLGSGISSKMSWVWNQAYWVAQKAVEAARQALDSHSPSRVMMDVGENFGEGFMLGISSMESGVLSTVRTLAQDAVEAVGQVSGVGRAAAMDLSRPLVLRTAGGSAAGQSQSSYSDNSVYNFGGVTVREESDIHALAEEISALKRRTRQGFGA